MTKKDYRKISSGYQLMVHGCANKGVPEYHSWKHMRQRCYNPRNKKYAIYGGRGIKICARWNDFENFFEDMGRKPSPEYSLDRINNNGNYEPKNCRWATPKQQVRNRSISKNVFFRGENTPLKDVCDILGVNYCTINMRLHRGWNMEQAVKVPVKSNK